MYLIYAFVILSIIGHISILTHKHKFKNYIYLLSGIALLMIWRINQTLSIPSAFAIIASILCIYRPNHKHCLLLVSLLSLGIFVFFLLNKPKIMEGHIYGVHPSLWETKCTHLDEGSMDCSSITNQVNCDDCGSHNCYWIEPLKKCIYFSPDSSGIDISGVDISNFSIPGTDDLLIDVSGTDFSGTDFSGQYFITRNNTTSNLCNMSGYCDASNNKSPATYCLNQTGGCAWSDASNICVDLDSITGSLSGYTTNPYNITSSYTYTEFVNDGKCISDQNDSSGNRSYCDITNDASICEIATWNTNENYGSVWNGNCKQPDNFCTDSSYDTVYCPKYIGTSSAYADSCEGNISKNTNGATSFECGTVPITVTCPSGNIITSPM